MTRKDTTFAGWPQELRLKRGLLNGERVQMAREARGIARYLAARKLGLSAQELAVREVGWHFWTEEEQDVLTHLFDFPLTFFVQDDPPAFAPMFMHGYDEAGESWCEYVEPKGKE